MIEGAEDRAVRSKTAPVNLLTVPRSDYVFFFSLCRWSVV